MSPSYLLDFAAVRAQTRLEYAIAQTWRELSQAGDRGLFIERQLAKASLRYQIVQALKDSSR